MKIYQLVYLFTALFLTLECFAFDSSQASNNEKNCQNSKDTCTVNPPSAPEPEKTIWENVKEDVAESLEWTNYPEIWQIIPLD